LIADLQEKKLIEQNNLIAALREQVKEAPKAKKPEVDDPFPFEVSVVRYSISFGLL